MLNQTDVEHYDFNFLLEERKILTVRDMHICPSIDEEIIIDCIQYQIVSITHKPQTAEIDFYLEELD